MIRSLRSLPALLTLVALTGCRGAEPTVPDSVILIGVDTLRADRLGLYDSPLPYAPFIDRQARRGMVFTRAYATSPWTLPSFASIFTGRLPSGHGVRVVLDETKERRAGSDPEVRGVFAKLHPTVPTLPEILAASGVTTTAVAQNPILSPAFRLDRGFEVYDYEAGDNIDSRRADEVVDRALEWIDLHRRHGKRFFLFLHFFDPHLNYDAPEPFRGTFTDGIESSLKVPIQGAKSIRSRIRELSTADEEFIEAAYNEEVRFVDHALGRFFDALEARGLWDESLVVLTSDHGEELFEHGGFEHGHDLFEELIRVPLIVWGPGVGTGEESTPVSIADIAPTILDACGVEPPQQIFGVSLWPSLTQGAKPVDRPLLAEATLYGAERKALIQWPYKLIAVPELSLEWLFDLEADSLEAADLSEDRPDLVRSLQRRMELLSSARGDAVQGDASLTPELLEKLRALGYVH